MSMKEKIEKTFTIYRQQDKYNQYDREQYTHLYININIRKEYGDYDFRISFLSSTSLPGYWYGTNVEIQAENMEKISKQGFPAHLRPYDN